MDLRVISLYQLPGRQGKVLSIKKRKQLSFPGGPVLSSVLPMQGDWVLSLVRELLNRSHVPQLRPNTAIKIKRSN